MVLLIFGAGLRLQIITMERQRAENRISQAIPEGLVFRFVGDIAGFKAAIKPVVHSSDRKS